MQECRPCAGGSQFARHVLPDQALRLALAPTLTARTGDERQEQNPDASDPLTAERELFTMVTGVEHEVDMLPDRLQNIAICQAVFDFFGVQRPGRAFYVKGTVEF